MNVERVKAVGRGWAGEEFTPCSTGDVNFEALDHLYFSTIIADSVMYSTHFLKSMTAR